MIIGCSDIGLLIGLTNKDTLVSDFEEFLTTKSKFNIQDIKKSTSVCMIDTDTEDESEISETQLKPVLEVIKESIKNKDNTKKINNLFTRDYKTRGDLRLIGKKIEKNILDNLMIGNQQRTINKRINKNLTIRGKVDGINTFIYNPRFNKKDELITDVDSYIFELKTRRKLTGVKPYEELQIQFYMMIFNKSYTKILEVEQDDFNINKLYTIKYNKEFIDSSLESLKGFVERFILLDTYDNWLYYFKLDEVDKREYIQNYLIV